MEADVQRRFSGNDSGSGTAEHGGSWHQVCRSSGNLRRKRLRIKLRMKWRITSMKQTRFRHEEQQHQADIESKRPCETTGVAANFTSDPGLQKNRESMTMESR